MSSGIHELGLREPPAPARRGAGRSANRGRGAPPFRRRRGSPGRERRPAAAAPALEGLSLGGTIEALSGGPRRRRTAGAGASAGVHLLLALAFLSGLAPSPEPGAPVPVTPEREPLLYAFEAPPPEVSAPPIEAAEPPPEEAAPDPAPTPPPPGEQPDPRFVIPEARIAVPATGFQNDLPFSLGEDDEFYTDEETGDDPEAEPDPAEPDPAEMAAAAFEPEPASEPPDAGTPAPEPGEGPVSEAGLLRFDAEAFRERIHDPAAAVREFGEEMARREAIPPPEQDHRKRGVPTDIWRFLDGKRFRNPEGGLVSNRNNTLYYDDRGANLVPWIGRLIAEVRRNWYIPYAATYDRGHVAIAIGVLRSGEIAWLQVVVSSGVPGFDNAAVGALRGARLLPLPDDYPGADFEIMLVFWYNEQPYDLFSASQ